MLIRQQGDIFLLSGMPNLWIIFLTGLLTGGITCAAVQGGLLIAVLANQKNPTNQTNPTNQMRVRMVVMVLLFVGAKLMSHTILGFLLGLMGEKLQFSIQFTSFMLGVASLFMIGMALNMLSVHPFFRRFAVTTPRFFRTLIWKQSKRTDFVAPILLGALTICIPCGVTQTMMAQAIAYGNPVTGALILFSFILGTAPLFILLGLAVTTLTETYKQWFEKIAAILIIGMALWNLYNVSTIFGMDTSFGQLLRPISCQIIYCDDGGQKAEDRKTTQTPIITIRQTEYEIDNAYIKAGEEIALTITNKDGYGCIQYFTIPKLGIQKAVPVGKTETIAFTAPSTKGELLFTCSMGMYRGHFTVQ
jgi:sulfite exporter TauE/SafE